MGVTTCEIHKDVGIGFTCKHIAENISERKNEKCIVVELRIFPGEKEPDWVNEETFQIPVCLQCFEDKQLSRKVKSED